jgi:hypothetical protein
MAEVVSAAHLRASVITIVGIIAPGKDACVGDVIGQQICQPVDAVAVSIVAVLVCAIVVGVIAKPFLCRQGLYSIHRVPELGKTQKSSDSIPVT